MSSEIEKGEDGSEIDKEFLQLKEQKERKVIKLLASILVRIVIEKSYEKRD